MARTKFRIKRDDTVKVIAGKDKGKIGRVLKVIPEQSRIIVEGVRRVRRPQKPVGDRAGGIVEKEAPFHISNVSLWNAEENRLVKVGYKFNEDGKKVRVDRKTGVPLDSAGGA